MAQVKAPTAKEIAAAAAAAKAAESVNGDQGDQGEPKTPAESKPVEGDQGGEQGDGSPVVPVAETIAEPPARMASAKEGTCGLPVMTTKGAKPCVKEPGHEGDHAMRKYTKPVDLSGLTIGEPEAFAADEEIVATDDSDRGDVQKTVDAQMKAAHEAWTAAGKPTTFPAAIKAGVAKRYFIEPEQADAYRSLLRSGARFLGISVKIAPVQKHKSGRTMLPWIPLDKRESQTTAASQSTGNANATATA